MLPSANDLVYFAEVAKTLNVSRAAERLGITQPSLTQALRRLEHEVGAPLLYRSKRGVTMTPAGKRVACQADLLLAQWSMVRTQALASMDQVQGTYKLGCHPSVGIYSLPQVLPQLFADYPKLEVQLVHQLSRQVFEGVVSMELDMALVINPPDHPDVILKKLGRDEMTFWMSQYHSKNLDAKNLRREDAVLICDPHLAQSQELIRKIKKQGYHFHRVIHSTSLEVIAHLTAAGAGIGILPGRVASTLGKNQLVPISAQAPRYIDELALVYRVEHKNIQTFKVLSQAFGEYFRRLADLEN
jgi:DNA-binding transcriptional LysR family regulator